MASTDNYLVVDIETSPQKTPDEFVFNYFDERKWSKPRTKPERKEIDQIIEPTLAQVICICLKGSEDYIETITDDEETKILEKFQEAMYAVYQETPNVVIVTFNGLSFDIPFIDLRCAILGVDRMVELPKRKYDFKHHFDVRMALTNWDTYGLGDLYFWAHVFGIPVDENIIKSDEVVEAYKKGELDKITAHCQQDVTVTDKLYLQIR